MLMKLKRHLPQLLAASLAFLVGLCSTGDFAYHIGCIQAHIDVARGQYQLQVYGTVDGGLEEFSEIAAREYGIEVVPHGCIISEQGIERMRGYNDVSEAAIKRKYGRDVIESIWDRALPEYRAKLKLR